MKTSTSPSRVCVIHPGAVGDVYVATPALVEVLERFPDSEFYVVGSAIWTQLLLPSRWPQIKGIIVFNPKTQIGEMRLADTQSETWIPQDRKLHLREFLKTCQVCVNFRYQTFRYAFTALRARVPVRIGCCPWQFKWLYTHWAPWLGKDPIIHERDRFLRIATATPRKWRPLGRLTYNLRQLRQEQTGSADTKADKFRALQTGQSPESIVYKWRERGLPRLQEPCRENVKVGLSDNYVLINPTASRREKAWPAERFRQFCAEISPWLREQNFQLAVIGAPNERAWLEEASLPGLAIVQPSDLRQLTDIVAFARALFTNASSMQFFANSQQVPTFTLLGRTFPARWGPLGLRDTVMCGTIPKGFPKDDIFAEEVVAYESISVEQAVKQFKDWFRSLE